MAIIVDISDIPLPYHIYEAFERGSVWFLLETESLMWNTSEDIKNVEIAMVVMTSWIAHGILCETAVIFWVELKVSSLCNQRVYWEVNYVPLLAPVGDCLVLLSTEDSK